MLRSLIFSIPRGTNPVVAKAMVAEIINAIPEDWKGIAGMLEASREMIERGEADASINLVFSSSIKQMIVGEKGKKPNAFGLIVENKKPASIRFSDDLTQCQVLSLEQVKKFALYYIRMGYTGHFVFDWRFDNSQVTNSCCHYECIISIPSGENDTPTITVEWDSEATHGARHFPMIDICRQLNLLELG